MIVNEALAALAGDFSALYSRLGRPSIPPEKLLRAMLLQAFYSIRSERQLMDRLEFDLLFRWFVGIGVDDAAWDHSTFSKNRDRLLEGDIAAKLLRAVLARPRVTRLPSTDHFSVDGTLIEAWASMKSFKPREGRDEPPADGGGRNGAGQGGEALLHGACADGEPQRPFGRFFLATSKATKTSLCFPMVRSPCMRLGSVRPSNPRLPARKGGPPAQLANMTSSRNNRLRIPSPREAAELAVLGGPRHARPHDVPTCRCA